MKSFTLYPRVVAAFSVCVLAVFFTPAKASADSEWRSLFNGKNLDGWEFRGKQDASAPTFDVEDGMIVGRTRLPANPTAFVSTVEQFKNFELVFEVKVDKNLNSGVQVRSPSEGTVRGAQVEIENGSKRSGFIYGQGMGKWLTDDIDEVSKTNGAFLSEEWNQFRVLVQGKNIKTWINGTAVADTTHDDIAPEGVVALQVHGHPRGKERDAGAKEILSVRWRNIRIREIGN